MRNNILKYTKENMDNKWDYENGYYLTSETNRLAKACAHYEMYKKIIDLPGDIMEFGVYKGASLIRLATYRKMLETDLSRKVIGFDMFGEFPRTNNDLDNNFIEEFEGNGGFGIEKEELEKFLQYKKIDNFNLIKGNILETLDKYLDEYPHTRISFLHIDVDVYEPTKYILDKLYDRVVRGGVIVFDDYNTVEGETRAVDEFLQDKSEKIKKLSLNYIPSYIEKV